MHLLSQKIREISNPIQKDDYVSTILNNLQKPKLQQSEENKIACDEFSNENTSQTPK